MRKVSKLAAIATTMAGVLIATPAGATAKTDPASPAGPLSSLVGCPLGNTYVISGNWDGIGGDGIGTVTKTADGLSWHLRNGVLGGSETTFNFGLPTDIPVVGNWDGIGGDGIGVVRVTSDNQWDWYVRQGANGGVAEYHFVYGSGNDYPVTGNWDGQGGDGVGVVSPGGGWHLRNGANAGNADYNFAYTGNFTARLPAAGNWDGIGGDGPVALGANSNGDYLWALRNDMLGGSPQTTFPYGKAFPSGCAVVGNWDGIGGDGIGDVYSDGARLQWHLRDAPNSGNANYQPFFGNP
ncbi:MULTISPECIES: hypothetical protein [unclassified Nonomuraea]|uniref:hypothetical protein n=1 Tax=unclassified Nonomuraea TaxID=2593643 RepID=UPI0033D64DB2